MTRRERLERKIEKRLEWAEGRERKADALRAIGSEYRHDWAFITQPGHIPERARMNRRDERAYEHGKMAAHHASKAAGLADQIEGTIFSDDPDAIEALREKIAGIERERNAIKAYNAAMRKAKTDEAKKDVLRAAPDSIRKHVEQLARVCAYQLRDGFGLPAYMTSNMGKQIADAKKRIEAIQGQQARQQAAEANGGTTIERFPDPNWCRVTFAEKPEREILNALRAAGYGWGGGSWAGYLDKLPEIVQPETEPPANAPDPFAKCNDCGEPLRDHGVKGECPDFVCPTGPTCPEPECQKERERRAD